jgi:Family of unknown function (DUF5906)
VTDSPPAVDIPPDYTACNPYTGAIGLAPDARAIAAFLRGFPHDRFNVGLFNPITRKMIGVSFARADIDAHAAGMGHANCGGWNLYLRPNGYARKFAGSDHPTKADVSVGYVSHIDADAPHEMTTEAERAAWCDAKATELEADGSTLVWFTGGGVQAAKLLREPVTLGPGGIAHEEFEEVNVAWANARGGDKCHDCSHYLRVAGGINWPDEKKKARGRVPALARVAANHAARRIDWGSLPREKPKGKSPAAPSSTGDITPEYVPLESRPELDGECADILRTGGGYDNRSRGVLRVAVLMAHAKTPKPIRVGLLMAAKSPIGDHVRENGGERYAVRQVLRGEDFASDDPVSFVNRDRFAAIEGSKVTYYREEDDGSVTPMNAEAFTFELAPHKVEIADAKGNVKRVPVVDIWKASSRRRFYPRGFVLDPTYTRDEGRYNLWRGFGIAEAEGDWSLIHDHIVNVLAAGDEGHAEYITRWTAWKLQNPGAVPRVAIALRGEEGIGKGFWGNGLVNLFGHHGLRVHNMNGVSGRFNAHMRHLCVLLADEVSVVDEEQEGALKGIITEPTLPIEGKGKDIIEADNHLAVLMSSNRTWCVPAGIGARRFAIFDVSDARKGDADYFARLFEHANRGGWSAMLHDLRRLNLAGWHPEANRPDTAALREQQLRSLKGLDRVVADLLLTGEIPWGELRGEHIFVPTFRLCEFVARRTKGAEPSANEVQQLLGRVLGFEKDDRVRPRGWAFPPLADARGSWDRARMPLAWPVVDGWSPGHPEYAEGGASAF